MCLGKRAAILNRSWVTDLWPFRSQALHVSQGGAWSNHTSFSFHNRWGVLLKCVKANGQTSAEMGVPLLGAEAIRLSFEQKSYKIIHLYSVGSTACVWLEKKNTRKKKQTKMSFILGLWENGWVLFSSVAFILFPNFLWGVGIPLWENVNIFKTKCSPGSLPRQWLCLRR